MSDKDLVLERELKKVNARLAELAEVKKEIDGLEELKEDLEMNIFINKERKREPFYRIVNYTSKTLISKHEYYGKAAKALEEYGPRGLDVIAIHNITHPRCPQWVKEL